MKVIKLHTVRTALGRFHGSNNQVPMDVRGAREVERLLNNQIVQRRIAGFSEAIGPSLWAVAPRTFDDAEAHRKVNFLLNRHPRFSYSVLVVDDVSVGVFEIRPGERPIYPPRDSKKLRRFEPWVRHGTNNDVASPDEVIEWARKDDRQAHQLHALEVEEKEARLRVLPRAARASRPTAGQKGKDSFFIECRVVNDEQMLFDIVALTLRLEWFDEIAGTVVREQRELPPVYEYHMTVSNPTRLHPGKTTGGIVASVTKSQILEPIRPLPAELNEEHLRHDSTTRTDSDCGKPPRTCRTEPPFTRIRTHGARYVRGPR